MIEEHRIARRGTFDECLEFIGTAEPFTANSRGFELGMNRFFQIGITGDNREDLELIRVASL